MAQTYRWHDAPMPLQSHGYPPGGDPEATMYPGRRFQMGPPQGTQDDADEPIISLPGDPADYELRAISPDTVGVFRASATAPSQIGTQDAAGRSDHIAGLRQLDAANRAFWRRR